MYTRKYMVATSIYIYSFCTDTLIWEAARATSAAPVYFKHFRNFMDGGIKANNPSTSALVEIHKYYTDIIKRKDYKVSCVVSLGCGKFSKPIGPIDVGEAVSWFSWISLLLKPYQTLQKLVYLEKTTRNLFKTFLAEVSSSLIT